MSVCAKAMCKQNVFGVCLLPVIKRRMLLNISTNVSEVYVHLYEMKKGSNEIVWNGMTTTLTKSEKEKIKRRQRSLSKERVPTESNRKRDNAKNIQH